MKVRFVEPRSAGYNFYSGYKLPRLGLPIIATIAKNAGYDVKVYVEEIAALDYDDIFSADVVGISTLTSTAPRAYWLADLIRKRGPKVILGGPHVTFLPEEGLSHSDYVVRGEAEHIILALMDKIANGSIPADVPGVSYRCDGKCIHNPISKPIDDLDKIPIPDLTLIHGWNEGKGIYPIITSRGCPYDCEFCSVTAMFSRRYRFRSVGNVMDELSRISNGRFVFFYDDNFIANPKRTKELLKEMIKLNLKWSAQVRVEVAEDEEFVELMHRAGCSTLMIGLESINPETLKEYNKEQTFEQIRKCVEVLKKYKIRIHGMFVVGADSDDKDTIHNTMKFVRLMNLDTVQICILTPLPGTRLFNRLESEGRLSNPKRWHLYDGLHVVFTPKRMTKIDLQVQAIKAMLKFYSCWRALVHLLKMDVLNAYWRWRGSRIIKKWLTINPRYSKLLKLWRGTQGDRGRSAKPLYVGANPTRA